MEYYPRFTRAQYEALVTQARYNLNDRVGDYMVDHGGKSPEVEEADRIEAHEWAEILLALLDAGYVDQDTVPF